MPMSLSVIVGTRRVTPGRPDGSRTDQQAPHQSPGVERSVPGVVVGEVGWSQGELADRVTADPAQIRRYESGRITPSADDVVRLAEVVDVSTDDLLVADASRRPFRRDDHALGERLARVSELGPDDLALVLNFIDALVTKTRLTILTGGLT